MAKKNEVEIKIKSTFDNKGVEEAKRETAELSKSSTEKASTTNADKDAKTAVEELTKAKKTLSRATATTKKNVEKLIESQEIANIAFEEAKPKVEELAKSYVLLDVSTATAKKNVKELADSNKRLASSKREVAQSTRQEETAQKKSTQTKSRARSATDQLLASQTMLNKENVRAVQRGNKLNEGLMQLSYIMDDVQYGMRGILNNIPGLVMGFGASAGVAGAVSIATLAGYKLYEWLNKENEAEKEFVKQQKERNNAFIASTKEASWELQRIKQEEANRKINDSFLEDLREVTDLYKEQNNQIKEQARLRLEEIAHQKNIDTAKSRKERAEIELRYEKGEISQATKDYLLLRNDQELQDKIHNSDQESKRTNIKALEEQLVNNAEAMQESSDRMAKTADALNKLPSFEEAQKLFQGEAENNQKIANLINDKNSIEKFIANQERLIQKLEPLVSDKTSFGRYMGAFQSQFISNKEMAEKDLASVSTKLEERINLRKSYANQIDSLAGLFEQGGVGYTPLYGDGQDFQTRSNDYRKALESLNKNMGEAKKKTDEYITTNKTLTEQKEKEERDLQRANELATIRRETDSIMIQKSNAITAKEIQKQLADEEKAKQREEEKLKKERERQRKEIESKRFEEQREIARSGALEISDKARSTRKGIAAIEAFNVGTAKLGESISQTDRNVSEAEMTSIILAMQQSLQKSGQHSKDLMAFLEKAMSKLVSRINDIETQTNKELEQLKTGITRAIQQ